MISRIEALNYRCLRYLAQGLDRFQVLVGPNASGKSTFLDVLDFMSDLVYLGPYQAVSRRAPESRDLVWMRGGDTFELAVEVKLPEERRSLLKNGGYESARYEVRIGSDSQSGEVSLQRETFWLIADRSNSNGKRSQRTLFPEPPKPPETIVTEAGKKAPTGWRKVVNKVAESGNDYFSSETSAWNNLFRLGPQKCALANLPEDETKFPIATWFKELLMLGVQTIALNSARMRQPSPPGAPKFFLPDGSNLPWAVEMLQKKDKQRYAAWLEHVRTALPEVKTIRAIERSEDRSRYLVIEYQSGLKVPSWLVSDGTLRMLALTLLAYVPDARRKIFLVEEPENGVHPKAVETVFQSLSSVYDAQILLATHSPVVLSVAKPGQVLCFAKNAEGATDVVLGSEHPKLKQWKGETDLGTLFASGILG